MKLLRETIRRMILEPQDTCDNLNEVLQSAINQMKELDLEIIHYMYSKKLRIVVQEIGSSKEVAIMKATQADPDWDGVCYSGYIVDWTNVKEDYRGMGIGALIYDIALELVGNTGLIADRQNVSEDAKRNWNYFYGSNEYFKKPLDNSNGEYTPDDPLDDCASGSHLDRGMMGDPNKEEFQSHSLNQLIVKKDQSLSTYKCLAKIGRIKQK